MLVCSNCGERNSHTATHCSKCSASLKDENAHEEALLATELTHQTNAVFISTSKGTGSTFTELKVGWRVLNAILFLVAFLAPWTHACREVTVNGFEATVAAGGIAFQGFTSPSAGWNEPLVWIVSAIFIGLVCILLYALVYSLLNFRPHHRGHFYLRMGMLAAGVLGMVSAVVFVKSDIKELLWGYWLAWVGLASSITLELIDRLWPDKAESSPDHAKTKAESQNQSGS
jgi:RsiW-degrading membrane proteinase PrsW (M82 family)